jgi:hypothetical protein
MKTEYQELAESLFEMQSDSIFNDPSSFITGNEWNSKFGINTDEKLRGLMISLVTPKEDIDQLAQLIKTDHENGLWTKNEDGGLYDYTMWYEYGGLIDNSIGRQLALLTGTGYQMQIFIDIY